jgi:hypothetical protein
LRQPQLLADVTVDTVVLAVIRRLAQLTDETMWTDIADSTGNGQVFDEHPALMRAVRRRDPDLLDHVRFVAPILLGCGPTTAAAPRWRHPIHPAPASSRDSDSVAAGSWCPSEQPSERGADDDADQMAVEAELPHLRLVAAILDLPRWLQVHEPDLFKLIYADPDAVSAASSQVTLKGRHPDSAHSDGSLHRSTLDEVTAHAVESAAVRLQVQEMRRQIERIRRDHDDDPEAAVGQAKELVETVCKTILGMAGSDADGDPVRFPRLVKQTLLRLEVDPSQIGVSGDPVQLRAAQQLMGGVSSLLHGVDELRNARGTGHGRSGAPSIDPSVARLAVGVVLPAVTYLVETYESQLSTN